MFCPVRCRQHRQALKDKKYKHHQPIKRRSANVISVLGFFEDDIKNRSKDIPGYMFVELDKGIFQLAQFHKQEMIVKKADWVDVFHNNWSN